MAARTGAGSAQRSTYWFHTGSSSAPVRAALEAEGIEWRHYYPEPVYRAPALGAERLPVGSCPEAERACAEAVAIPVRPTSRPRRSGTSRA